MKEPLRCVGLGGLMGAERLVRLLARGAPASDLLRRDKIALEVFHLVVVGANLRHLSLLSACIS